jgi:hypothetical protein
MQQWHILYAAITKRFITDYIYLLHFYYVKKNSLQVTKWTHNLLIKSEILSILIGHWVCMDSKIVKSHGISPCKSQMTCVKTHLAFFLKFVEISVQKCFFCLVLWSHRYCGAGRGPFQHSTAWYLKTIPLFLGLYDFGSIDKSQRPQKSSTCYRLLHSTLPETHWVTYFN